MGRGPLPSNYNNNQQLNARASKHYEQQYADPSSGSNQQQNGGQQDGYHPDQGSNQSGNDVDGYGSGPSTSILAQQAANQVILQFELNWIGMNKLNWIKAKAAQAAQNQAAAAAAQQASASLANEVYNYSNRNELNWIRIELNWIWIVKGIGCGAKGGCSGHCQTATSGSNLSSRPIGSGIEIKKITKVAASPLSVYPDV